MYILYVYIYFTCINTQLWATSQFDNAPFSLSPNGKYWKTEPYWRSADHGEGDSNSYINILDSDNFSAIYHCYQPVLEIALEPEYDVFGIAIIDIILRSSLVGFSLLRARYYYNRKGPICYVFTV